MYLINLNFIKLKIIILEWFNYTCDKPAFKDKLLDY